MMKIKELLEIDARYVAIELEGDVSRYINENFEALLKYIGTCYPVDGRNEIGAAYKKIRETTDNLLHVHKMNNRKLKTSKREVASIRQAKYDLFKDKEEHYYIRIPYKVSFIFEAIISIVEDVSQDNPFPDKLKSCIGQAYRYAFYARHIAEYEQIYRDKLYPLALANEDYADPIKLHDDFDSVGSVFNKRF